METVETLNKGKSHILKRQSISLYSFFSRQQQKWISAHIRQFKKHYENRRQPQDKGLVKVAKHGKTFMTFVGICVSANIQMLRLEEGTGCTQRAAYRRMKEQLWSYSDLWLEFSSRSFMCLSVLFTHLYLFVKLKTKTSKIARKLLLINLNRSFR